MIGWTGLTKAEKWVTAKCAKYTKARDEKDMKDQKVKRGGQDDRIERGGFSVPTCVAAVEGV